MNTPENKAAHEQKHCKDNGDNCTKCGKKNRKYARLAPFSLAMASGVVYGLSILALAWLGTSGHMNSELFRMMGSVGLRDALFAFIGGFVCSLIFAWIYNACLCCWICRSSCCKCSKCGSYCCKC